MEIKLDKEKVVVIDDDDFELIKNYKWYAYTDGKGHWYALTSIKTEKGWRGMRMHRLIMKASPNEQVDHINHNGLDNRRENIRICTVSQNHQNRHITRGKSLYKGVYWDKEKKKWRAHIWIDRKRQFLGYFKTAKEAAERYNKEASELFKEFACLNEI